MISDTEFRFSRASRLRVSPDALWSHITAMKGVNREFFPLLRMSYPYDSEDVPLDQVPLGKRLFRSWIFLFGIIPIDYDDLTLIEIFPHRGFQEASPTLANKIWRHRRMINEVGGGCVITDEVEFNPKWKLAGRLFLPVYRLLFAYRHWRLRRIWGPPL